MDGWYCCISCLYCINAHAYPVAHAYAVAYPVAYSVRMRHV